MKNCWLIGASHGIGAELAKKLFKEGYNVAISARSVDDLQKLKTEVEVINPEIQSSQVNQISNRILVFPFDVTDFAMMESSWQKIIVEFKKIDLVIFASAIYKQMNLKNFDLDFAKKIIDVNLVGYLNFLYLVAPKLIEQKSGHIAVIASVAGYCGLPESFAYGASKAAIINLSEGIFPELQENKVKISIINPGFVKTRLTDQNKFQMPFLISASEASEIIYEGLNSEKFEIHFPKKFTFVIKFFRIFPYKVFLFIVSQIYRKNYK